MADINNGVLFLWRGLKDLEDVVLNPVESTLKLSEEQQRAINSRWSSMKNEPEKYDGQLWRPENARESGGKLIIDASPIAYSAHSLLRHEKGRHVSFYPNPIGVNSLQETDDGYILLGLKGRNGDYKGLVSLGSGFIERDKHPKIIDAVVDECTTETSYGGHEFLPQEAKALALVFGSNHDTGIPIHLLIPLTHKEVSLGNEEHSDLIVLPNNPQTLNELLKSRQYRGLAVTDQLSGSIESYLHQKQKGGIQSRFQH